MQCPRCGSIVDDTDTFCEKCGLVFADYNQIQIQKKQAIPETENIPNPQITIQQQELAAKFLCNSENYVITNHSFKKEKLVSKQAVVNNNDLEEKDFSNSLVKILVAITILAVIFFVYFFVII